MSVTTTDIPARLDRLPWSGWHWLIVVALGITWILDGLEVTMVGSVGARLEDAGTLGLSSFDVGFSATAYLVGAVAGALIFGYLTDRFGRKKLFLITLGCYLVATLLTAASWNATSFECFRFLTGFGIGGEYAAINSTIDELIPAARRGFVDLAINGTYWFGAIIGSGASIVLLDERFVDQHYGWRIAFAIGALFAVVILFIRTSVPESPRWLLMHDRAAEAETNMREIEAAVASEKGALPPPQGTLVYDANRRHAYGDVWHAMLRAYPQRTFVAMSLMVAQAFLYNAIFFTVAIVLSTFFGVAPSRVGLYIFPFALGNLLGPLVLGPLFDSTSRKLMISATYLISGLGLFATGLAFANGILDATTITVAWCVIFFFASAGASAAYLTASETFPLEIRAQAISLVYGIGTLTGGALAPALFGALIATRSPINVFYGYLVGAVAMCLAAGIEARFGVEAAGLNLEDIAPPLSAAVPSGP